MILRGPALFFALALGLTWLTQLPALLATHGVLAGPAARYRVKSWRDGAPEPAAWDFETTETRNVIPAGGALFVSHNTDVTVGTITVTANNPLEP